MVMMTREDYYAQIEAEDRRFREYLMLRNDDDDETWTETDWWYRSKKENPENQICNDEEYSSQISDSLSFNRPDPKPIYEIKADKEIPKASSKSKRRYKLQKRISCEELDEITMKGLCVFCEEPETPGHYLQHPNSCLLMIDSEDHLSDSMVNKIGNPEEQALDDGELVETEVVTESDGIEQQTVNNEENANENLDILEEESITQIQVPVSSLESSLQFHNASSDICDDFKSSLFGHQEAMLQVSHVKVRDELLTKSTDVTNNQAAHYLFDKMPLRMKSKRRHIKCHKSWRFKFKQRVASRESKAGFEVNMKHNQSKEMLLQLLLSCTHKKRQRKTPKYHKSWKFRFKKMDMKFQEVLIDDVLSVMVYLRMVETSSDLMLLNGEENKGCLNGLQALVLMKGITESSSRIEVLMKEEPEFVTVNEVKMEKQKQRKCSKCWMFKFRKGNIDQWLGGYNLIATYLENKKTWMFKYKAPKDTKVLETSGQCIRKRGSVSADRESESNQPTLRFPTWVIVILLNHYMVLLLTPVAYAIRFLGGVGMDKKPFHLPLRNHQVWDPGG